MGRDFPYLSRPALRPIQPPAQWVPGFPEGKERAGRDADPSLPSSAAVKKEKSYTSTSLMDRTACTEPQCLYKGALYCVEGRRNLCMKCRRNYGCSVRNIKQ